MLTRRFQLISMCAALGLVSIVCATGPASAVPVNGGFETGDLSGWSTFDTPNGTAGPVHPTVVLFDTDDDGTASFSAQFSVGKLGSVPAGAAGGGLFQEIDLLEGDLFISVNVAADASDYNASAGLFDLIFDGAVIDTVDLGSIQGGTAKFGQLAGSVLDVSAGTHEIRVRIGRPYQTPPNLYQYVDDFSLSGTAVPEPGTALLMATGLALAGAVRRSPRTRGA
jgi:hypothetical protein